MPPQPAEPVLPSVHQRVRHGVFWNFLATFFNQGSMVLCALLIVRFMGKAVFGQFYVLQVTIVGALIIAQAMVGYPLIRYLAEYCGNNSRHTSNLLGGFFSLATITAAGIAVALLVSGNWIAHEILKLPELGLLFRLTAGILFFQVLDQFFVGAMAGLEEFKTHGVLAIISGLLLVCAVLAACSTELKTVLIVWLIVVGLKVLGYAICLLRITRRRGIHWGWRSPVVLGPMVRQFVVPYVMIGVLGAVATWLAMSYLARFRGEEGTASFGLPQNFRQFILFFPTVVNGVVVSILNHLRGKRQALSAKKIYLWSILLAGGCSAILAGLVIMIGPWMLGLFGKTVTGDWMVLVVVCGSAIPMAIGVSLSQSLTSQDKIWSLFFVTCLPRDIMMIVLACYLCKHYGAIGLAWTHLLVYVYACLSIGYLAWRNPVTNLPDPK